jgi:hypothetical protein
MHTSEPHFLQLLLSLKPHKLISLGLTITFLEGRKGGEKEIKEEVRHSIPA